MIHSPRVYVLWVSLVIFLSAGTLGVAWLRLYPLGPLLFTVLLASVYGGGYVQRGRGHRPTVFLVLGLITIMGACVIMLVRSPNLTAVGRAGFSIFAALAAVGLAVTLWALRPASERESRGQR